MDRNDLSCPSTIMSYIVAPRRGAWIEITYSIEDMATRVVAPRRGAWIEICYDLLCKLLCLVAPRRGAWIEILDH